MEHEWRISVRRPVSVREAKTDCGCTLARLELERDGNVRPYELEAGLVPGDALKVSVRYDTLGRSGPSTRAVSLALSEGLLALALTADVQPWLRADPPALSFTRVREGSGTEATFRVSSVAGEAFRLSATGRALPPWVRLSVGPEDGDREGRSSTWQVTAALGLEAPRGLYSYALELETDVAIPGASAGPAGAPPRHFALAPVWSLQVVGPVALSRSSLEFGLIEPRETVSRSLRLDSFDERYEGSAVRARLLPVHEGDPFPLERTARVLLRPGAGGCEIEVVLAGLDPAVTGTFLAKLVVETGHPRLPELEALVRGTCNPAGDRP